MKKMLLILCNNFKKFLHILEQLKKQNNCICHTVKIRQIFHDTIFIYVNLLFYLLLFSSCFYVVFFIYCFLSVCLSVFISLILPLFHVCFPLKDAIGEIKNRDWEINAMGERFSAAKSERVRKEAKVASQIKR